MVVSRTVYAGDVGERSIYVIVVLAALGCSACYIEAGVGYYPSVNQRVDAVAPNGMETSPAVEASTGALAFSLRLGLYFDLPFGYRCPTGCAPVSVGVATAGGSVRPSGDDAPLESSTGGGPELRADVDLPWRSDDYKLRFTGIYGHVNGGEQKFSNMTITGTTPSKGSTLLAGLTFSSIGNYGGATLGLSRLSWDSAVGDNGGTPSAHLTATGAELRIMFALPSSAVLTYVKILERFKPTPSWRSNPRPAGVATPSDTSRAKSRSTTKTKRPLQCTFKTVCGSGPSAICKQVKTCR